jgi:hypothetical protein
MSPWFTLKFKAVMATLRWANMQEREGKQVDKMRGWSEHLF